MTIEIDPDNLSIKGKLCIVPIDADDFKSIYELSILVDHQNLPVAVLTKQAMNKYIKLLEPKPQKGSK